MIYAARAHLTATFTLRASFPGGLLIEADEVFDRLSKAVDAMHLARTQLLTPRYRFLSWGFFPAWVKELRDTITHTGQSLQSGYLQVAERSDDPHGINGYVTVREIPIATASVVAV